MTLALAIVVVVLAVLALIPVPTVWFLRRTRASGEARVDAVLAAGPPELRRTTARSLGHERAGRWQVRGTGTLALTAEAVHFAQWASDRALRIPRRSITAVDTARSHLGKRVGADLLRIAWDSEAGPDVVAFQVPDLGDWLAALRG